MDANDQLAKLKTLQTDLLKVLPERFELHEAFDVEQDLHIVLWDTHDEQQYILRASTTTSKVITQLLSYEKEAGRQRGRIEIQAPIKSALGL